MLRAVAAFGSDRPVDPGHRGPIPVAPGPSGTPNLADWPLAPERGIAYDRTGERTTRSIP